MNHLAVIIPVYNASQYIGRCLQSCIEQPEIDDIIVVDDGSTDDSLKIIDKYESQDARIRVLQHKDLQNHGRSASRNLGIKNTKCEWITFCDADDYYLENRFKQFDQLEKKEIDGTYEWVQSSYNTKKLSDQINPITHLKTIPSSRKLQDYLIAHREERLSIIGIIVKKSLIESVGYFDEDLVIGEDTDLIWRLTDKGIFQYIENNPIKIIRCVHDQNTYTNGGDRDKILFNFYKKWLNKINQYNPSNAASHRIKSSYRYYRFLNAKKDAGSFKRLWLTIVFRLFKRIK